MAVFATSAHQQEQKYMNARSHGRGHAQTQEAQTLAARKWPSSWKAMTPQSTAAPERDVAPPTIVAATSACARRSCAPAVRHGWRGRGTARPLCKARGEPAEGGRRHSAPAEQGARAVSRQCCWNAAAPCWCSSTRPSTATPPNSRSRAGAWARPRPLIALPRPCTVLGPQFSLVVPRSAYFLYGHFTRQRVPKQVRRSRLRL